MKLSVETHKMLSQIGTKEETYDQVIRRLLEHYIKTRKKPS